MPTISINHLSFSYDATEPIFDNVSLNIDTSWNLGLIGRNGKGKSTLLNILRHKLEYDGQISTPVRFASYPLEIPNKQLTAREIFALFHDPSEEWKLEVEASQLQLNYDDLSCSFNTLSEGQQTKIQLAILFSGNHIFALLDEPTNHLDAAGRQILKNYLRRKHGFILISHDRDLLDSCTDHILALNRSKLTLEQGNFSTWYQNKQLRDAFEQAQNNKLVKSIHKLEAQAKQKAAWANTAEAAKYHPTERGFFDRGYISHRASKIMNSAVIAKKRAEQDAIKKSSLLKDIEKIDTLRLRPLENRNGRLIDASNLSYRIDKKPLFSEINFNLSSNERLRICGSNGSGKTTLLRIINGEISNYDGRLNMPQNLKISYLSQDTSFLKGNLRHFVISHELDLTLFMSLLNKLDFTQYSLDLSQLSDGQKKKILLAKSLAERANVYIWDEPLNYLDIFSRIQLEQMLIRSNATMIFVEHDESFAKKIATKQLLLS